MKTQRNAFPSQPKPHSRGIMQIFWDVDFRCQHIGLGKILEEHGIDPKNMKPGDYVVFINTRQDRLRVLSGTPDKSRGVLSYYISPRGRIEKRSLQYIPQAFGARGFEYSKALEKALATNLLRGRGLGEVKKARPSL